MKTKFSIDELMLCVTREIAYSQRVYRRLVGDGRMKPEEAEREIAMMEAVRDNLETQQQPRLF